MENTISQDLLDYMLISQIFIGRYSNKVTRDIITLLNAAEKDIIQQIEKRMDVKNFTGKRLEALLTEIRTMNSEAYAGLHDSLKQQMLPFAVHSGEVAAVTLASQLPVAFNVLRVSDNQLRAIVSTTPIRIGTDRALLLGEVFEKLTAGREDAIRGALRLSMIEGESIPQAVRRLRGTRAANYQDGVLNASRRDAEAIARTVIQSVNNSAAQATYAENDDVLNGWQWISTLDSRTCSYCMARSGKKYKTGDTPPPLHVRCRCFAAPVVKSWKELGFDNMPDYPSAKRASASGLVDADISFNDWLKTQPRSTQVDLLGVKRAELFANGSLKLDKMIDNSGRFYTLDELKSRM